MEPEEYRVVFEQEENHWWYAGMRGISLALLDRFGGRGRGLDILDAGCGTGGMLLHFAPYGQAVGLDFSREAMAFCQKRGLQRLCRASVSQMPFARASFDLVTSFDVLYHRGVEDDIMALREFHRVLRGGGLLLLRVPAYNFLRGRHDRVVHTRRRYTAAEIGRKLHYAGFQVLKLSYVNTLLFPFAALSRALERFRTPRQNGSDIRPTPPLLNAALTQVLLLEGRLLHWATLPFGLSVLCLARKIEPSLPGGRQG